MAPSRSGHRVPPARHDVRGATAQRFATETILLRVPVARTALAEAERVVAHFERVLRREIIVDPGFWPSRIRIGLSAAAPSPRPATPSGRPPPRWKTPPRKSAWPAAQSSRLAGWILALGAWWQMRGRAVLSAFRSL